MNRRITGLLIAALIGILPLAGCERAAPTDVSSQVADPAATQSEEAPQEAIPPVEQTNAAEEAIVATPEAGGACIFTGNGEFPIFTRPSNDADLFSTQPDGTTIEITAQTADGWLGFDPGVAQAANSGSFRLRWIPRDAGSINDGCGDLPIIWGPPAGICFEMPMEVISIHEEPDSASAVVGEMAPEEFAAILGYDTSGDWAQVDLAPGNTGETLTGWIPASALNMNGPCEELPTIAP